MTEEYLEYWNAYGNICKCIWMYVCWLQRFVKSIEILDLMIKKTEKSLSIFNWSSNV